MTKNKSVKLDEIESFKNEITKLKFHNACLLYLFGDLRDKKKLKHPTMQEVCAV